MTLLFPLRERPSTFASISRPRSALWKHDRDLHHGKPLAQLYIGVTSDLRHRVWQHKNGTHPGFTSQYRITRLVYYEEFVLMQNAIAREKQLKRWSRSKKLWLIAMKNPAWVDLAEEWYHPESVPPKRTSGPSTPPRNNTGLRSE